MSMGRCEYTSFFHETPKKKVGWGEVWRIWRPHNWSTSTAPVATKCVIQVLTDDCGPMRRCTVLFKHNIHAVVLLQLGYEKVLQLVHLRSSSNCFLPKHEWPIQFMATYPAPDIDFRTNPFQLVGDMQIFSSPYDCIVGVRSPTKMEGSLVRK